MAVSLNIMGHLHGRAEVESREKSFILNSAIMRTPVRGKDNKDDSAAE